MVRGNWQRRVELNESRRNEAKQRKHRNEEKKIFKAQVQNLIDMLDRNKDSILQKPGRSWELHVWTDTFPSDAPPILDIWDEKDTKSSKRRKRSASIESEGGGQSGRSRSGSGTPSSGKKKAHPRSKESFAESETGAPLAPRLCRTQFFAGKCENRKGGKKGGCRLVHYPKHSKTLAEIVSDKNVLSLSESALTESSELDDGIGAGDSTSMEMLYYFPISVAPDIMNSDECNSFSDLIVGSLSKKSCAIGSVVFFAMNEHLLYDRQRGGLIVENSDLASILGLSGTNQGGSFVKSETLVSLPGSVLEYVLTYLPDNAVASMSSVCRSWNLEIGKQSVNLWRHLLLRRAWPVPTSGCQQGSSSENLSGDNRTPFREAYISHYSAVRDMKAVREGLTGILRKKSVDERETCFTAFESWSSSRGAPQYPNYCKAVEIWSPNRVLAAYSLDCTLRLFETVERSGSGTGRLCRELVCQRIDPYKNTKRRSSILVALAVDDFLICCLCRVLERDHHEGFILAVLSREDFLVADVSEDDGTINVIDVGQSVLDFLLSCDEVDHGLLQLKDFLSSGGEMDEVEVLVSQSLICCGYGRFMVEVAVSIPSDDVTDESDLLLRKLFVFSSSVGAIVWMCDSNTPLIPLRPRYEDMNLALVKETEEGSQESILVSVPAISPGVMTASIDPNGNYHSAALLQGSDLIWNDLLNEGWEARSFHQRPIVATRSEVIVADSFVREDENGRKQFKVIVNFHPHLQKKGVPMRETITLDGNMEVCLLVPLRKDHILAICRLYSGQTEMDDIDGHWFGNGSNDDVSIYAIIIHTSTRSEIERIHLINDLTSHLERNFALGELPLRVVISGGTVAVSTWWKGIIITGEEVRLANDESLVIDQAQSPAKAKKKKKKTHRKGGKKDGFARGMSLRG